MLRRTALLLALSASAAIAQSSPKPDVEAAKKTWAGVWEGPVWHMGESDPIGGFRLEIARDTAWKLSIDVVTGATTSGFGMDFVPDGNRATWYSALMGNSCKTTAAIEDKKLKGEVRCGGEHAGGLSFELTKRQ